jgi:hypothetical protein
LARRMAPVRPMKGITSPNTVIQIFPLSAQTEQ